MEAKVAFIMPLEDRALLESLQERHSALFQEVSGSDLVRAGLRHLGELSDTELRELLDGVLGATGTRRAL
jgi:hypothetical protein